MDRLLSIGEAAAVLGLSSWTIRAWVANGKMASVKLGTRRLVSQEEISRLIAEGTAPALKQSNRGING